MTMVLGGPLSLVNHKCNSNFGFKYRTSFASGQPILLIKKANGKYYVLRNNSKGMITLPAGAEIEADYGGCHEKEEIFFENCKCNNCVME